MIDYLIRKLLSGLERRPEQQDIMSVSPVQETAPPTNSALYDDPEIQIFASRFGDLVDGKMITTTLAELEEILPRPRRRADAYTTVAKRLAAMGVQLVIKREVRHDK